MKTPKITIGVWLRKRRNNDGKHVHHKRHIPDRRSGPGHRGVLRPA